MTSVLLVRLSAMGDLVQCLGAVGALRQARPDWRLTFVTQTAFAPLLEGLGLHRVVCFERRGGWRGVRAVRRALREDRYDVALDLQGNWKSAFVARLSGARRRVGMAAAARQEPRSRWLLTETVPCAEPPHPALTAWRLVRRLAPEVPFALPRLEASAEEREREAAALAALGVDASRPFAVFVVTDPRDARALRPDVIERETARAALPVVHLVGPAEAALAERAASVPTLRHGRGEPRRLVALGNLVARANGFVWGPDQGATHVLAAAGARSFVAFGAQDPRRTAPPGATVLGHAAPPACSPCRSTVCRHPQGPVCMAFGREGGRELATGLPVPGTTEE